MWLGSLDPNTPVTSSASPVVLLNEIPRRQRVKLKGRDALAGISLGRIKPSHRGRI